MMIIQTCINVPLLSSRPGTVLSPEGRLVIPEQIMPDSRHRSIWPEMNQARNPMQFAQTVIVVAVFRKIPFLSPTATQKRALPAIASICRIKPHSNQTTKLLVTLVSQP